MKTVVVTGATSGIGLAVCEELLHHQYRVIGVGRTAETVKRQKTACYPQFRRHKSHFITAI